MAETADAKVETEEKKAVEEKQTEGDAEMKDAGEAEKDVGEAGQLEKPAKLVPEKPKELEEDASADGRGKIAPADVTFLTEDTTLNVMPIAGGKLLTSLSDGGCQYLLAGARASVGVKSGRYMFEVKIVEKRNPSEPHNATQGPMPRQLVRVGVSTGEASLFLPDGGVCFDSEGKYQGGEDKIKAGRTFAQNQVIAVLLNLDPSSPNAYTISLFSQGARVSEPQKLPESLRGKTLFPVVSFRNVTLQINFGPEPLRQLPFKCRSLGDAARDDCEVKTAAVPQSGKYEVIFPVGMPDEGTFAWLDQFLKKNKNYTELSDRMIVNWAMKSGIQRSRQGIKPSLDKPDMESGLQLMDDFSVRRIIKALAPALDRNFVVMEVKKNLLGEERKKALASFPTHSFRRICQVRMGEPDEEFKAGVLDQILSRKKVRAEADAKRKREAQAKKKAEELRKKKAEAAKKAREEAAKKAKEARMKKAAGEEVPAEETSDEKMEEEKEDELEEEIVAEEVSLTEEDRKVRFAKKDTPDVNPAEVSSAFAKFTLPDNDEGFDQIVYAWQPEEKCKDELKAWQLNKKLTERVEDLQPSDWFKGKWDEWKKAVSGWKKKQQEFKDPALKRKAAAAKKKAEEDKKKKEADEKKDGDEKKEGEDDAPTEKEADTKMEINVEELDVFSVEDVTDVGNGEPLFAHYAYEDWTLLGLRYELHLLVHAFRKDLNDAERPSFSENHLGFYYNKYFKKQLTLKDYGFSKLAELVELVKDTADIGAKGCLETQLSDDTPLENFVKLAEDHRRDRARRAEAGDETAELKFTRQSVQHGNQAHGSAHGGQKRPHSPGPSSYSAPAKSTRYEGRGAPPPPRSAPPRHGGGGGGGGGSCRQFQNNGHCKFGSQCRFSH